MYLGRWRLIIFLGLVLLSAIKNANGEPSSSGSSWPISLWKWMNRGSSSKQPISSQPQQPQSSAEEKSTTPPDYLLLCSWNIFRFGPGKFSFPDPLIEAGHDVTRMDIIVDQLRDCDIAAIQEYMDLSGTAIKKLQTALQTKTGNTYSLQLSPRVGRTKFEQYVFLYRSDKVSLLTARLFPDIPDAAGNKLFQREPYFAKFLINNPQPNSIARGTVKATEMILGTIHTVPEEAVAEINHLVQAFDWASNNFSSPDVLVMGDYNADCSYVLVRDWPYVTLWTEPRFTWLVSRDMDTTSMSTHCAYDRAVYIGSHFGQTYVSDSVEAPDFPAKFDLTPAQAKLVSDHRLIRMKFRLD